MSSNHAEQQHHLSAGEAARHLGVSIETLRIWERKGLISPQRTLGGHRRYSRDEIDALLTTRSNG